MNVTPGSEPLELSDGTPGSWEAWGEAYGGIVDGESIESLSEDYCMVLKYNDGLLSLNMDYELVSGDLTEWNG